MNKIKLIALFITPSLLLASNIEDLPFSGGKFGKNETISSSTLMKNVESNKRSSCYSYVHLAANLHRNSQNYWLYRMTEYRAKSTATYGTSTASCNIAWNAPIISAEVYGYYNHFDSNLGWQNPQTCHNKTTKYNASYADVTCKHEEWGGSEVPLNNAVSYHVAGGMSVNVELDR